MFYVDKIKYEHLAILSNLTSSQFAPRIVIFNLCICCQFEDSQIISPNMIYMSHRNIKLTNEGSFLQKKILFLLVHNSEYLDNQTKNYYFIRTHFNVV